MKINKDMLAESLVDREATIIGNRGDHGFTVGEVVTITSAERSGRNNGMFILACSNGEGRRWNVRDYELSLTPNCKSELAGEMATLN